MMGAKKAKSLADLLRDRIRSCGLSARKLEEATGVSQPTITVFLNGGDIRLMTAQKLMDYFGIRCIN